MAPPRKKLSFQYQAPEDPAFYSVGKDVFAVGCIGFLILGALFALAYVVVAVAIEQTTP